MNPVFVSFGIITLVKIIVNMLFFMVFLLLKLVSMMYNCKSIKNEGVGI